jgi:hypothetical protein
MSNAALFDFAEQVHYNLGQSAVAYKEYLQNGKTFKHAQMLKIYNEKIKELLLENRHLLSNELQENSKALIEHYDIWLEKWNDLAQKLNPLPDDEFVFANEFTFPRKAAVAFEMEYNRLKQLTLPGNKS